MENMDFEGQIAVEGEELIRKWTEMWDICHDGGETIDATHVGNMLVNGVWNRCLGLFRGTCEKGYDPLNSEKIVSVLLRGGVSPDSVRCRRNMLRVRLENYGYRFHKRETVLFVRPDNPLWNEVTLTGADPEEFAAFLRRFDGLVPKIFEEAGRVCETAKRKAMEMKVNRCTETIVRRSVDSQVERYLTPLGIRAEYSFEEDFKFLRMDLRQVLTATLRMPVGDVVERLRDTPAILSSLRPVPPEEPEEDTLGRVRR